MISGYKSIKTIFAGLYRDLGYNTELNSNDLVEWVFEGLQLIGAFSQDIDKPECLDICNHETVLPFDFYKLIEISHNKKPMHWANPGLVHQYGCEGCKVKSCCTENDFYITESHIRTSLKEGKICISYLAVPTCEDGYPLVPDDVYFDKALKSYCTYMLDRIEFRKQKLPEVAYRDSEKDWLWYVAAAKGSANMPNTQQLQRLMNVWVRLIPKQDSYNKMFRDIDKQEQRKTF